MNGESPVQVICKFNEKKKVLECNLFAVNLVSENEFENGTIKFFSRDLALHEEDAIEEFGKSLDTIRDLASASEKNGEPSVDEETGLEITDEWTIDDVAVHFVTKLKGKVTEIELAEPTTFQYE